MCPLGVTCFPVTMTTYEPTGQAKLLTITCSGDFSPVRFQIDQDSGAPFLTSENLNLQYFYSPQTVTFIFFTFPELETTIVPEHT